MNSDRFRRLRSGLTVASAMLAAVGTGAGAPCPPESESARPYEARRVVHDDPEEVVPAPRTAPPSRNPFLVRVDDPDDPAVRAYAAARKQILEVEREMKLIRAKHFRGIRKTEIRQEGILKLREFTSPVLYPSLLEIFSKEKADVREAIFDHLADQKRDEADAALAWAAVFDGNRAIRGAAFDRLVKRMDEVREAGGRPSDRVKTVIAAGLRDESNTRVATAAHLADVLKLFELIPLLANAQVAGGGAGTGGGGEGTGALAYIMIGTQQAFIADLQPVVGDSAVGFDPELAVVTDGVVMAVGGAYVVTYRTEVHGALMSLASAGWGGRSVAHLGWDRALWREWYANEFVPYRREVEAGRLVETPGKG